MTVTFANSPASPAKARTKAPAFSGGRDAALAGAAGGDEVPGRLRHGWPAVAGDVHAARLRRRGSTCGIRRCLVPLPWPVRSRRPDGERDS